MTQCFTRKIVARRADGSVAIGVFGERGRCYEVRVVPGETTEAGQLTARETRSMLSPGTGRAARCAGDLNQIRGDAWEKVFDGDIPVPS